MSPRVLHATRKEIPPAMRCARSGCKRVGVVIPGAEMQLCLSHAKGKRNKYGSKRSTSPLLGRSFHSQAERARGEELSLLERSGAIRNLRFQVPVPLRVNGELVCTWVSDFLYETTPTACYHEPTPQELTDDGWRITFEDLKGFRDAVYAIKAKLFHAVMGFSIYETKPAPRRR